MVNNKLENQTTEKDNVFYRNFGVTCEKVFINEKGNKVFQTVFTEQIIDRADEIVMIDGIQTANYANNPVILWRHESHNLPIAICSNLSKINNKLIGDIEFSQKLADKYPDVQMFIDYIEEKYLRTVSIGFKPINKRVEKQGDNLVIIHEVCDLVECSVVTIPMNPNATIMREYNMQTKEGRVLSSKRRDKLIQCQMLINELLEDSAMNEDKPNEDKKPTFDENLLENSFRNINKKELENLLLNKTII